MQRFKDKESRQNDTQRHLEFSRYETQPRSPSPPNERRRRVSASATYSQSKYLAPKFSETTAAAVTGERHRRDSF